MRNIKPTFILMALEKELREHDWTFNMSDDQRYWRAGTDQQKRIKTMVDDAYAEGVDPADIFYEFYLVLVKNIPTNFLHYLKIFYLI